MYMYIYVYIYTYVYARIHTCMYIYIYVHTHIYTYIYLRPCCGVPLMSKETHTWPPDPIHNARIFKGQPHRCAR